jgi:hypothetical protein
VSVVRIGCGAGYAGDRVEPAVELAARGRLDYLVFECLAERTLALAQRDRARDPALGYDARLVERLRAVLPSCLAQGVTVITNMGAANPAAAAAVAAGVVRELGGRGVTIAAVTGDDVLGVITAGTFASHDTGEPLATLADRFVAANAYVGMEPILEALAAGARIVITGRVADPSLFLAPLVQRFGWRLDDWPRLGAGTLVGHLLECAGQVTGGYFADPGRKDVAGLARLGFPIAEVHGDGRAVITKVAGSGGLVTRATCTEQLLYEIHDPAAYVTPDVVADFSGVTFTDDGPDRVAVHGATGRARTASLKTSVAYRDGFIGEGQISYCGSGAVARARLGLEIVRERLAIAGVAYSELRGDVIGVDALAGAAPALAAAAAGGAEPAEVRLRVAGRTGTLADAVRIGDELETLYTNGPAGGGGVTKGAREVLALDATLVPRDRVRPVVSYLEA